MNYEQTIAWMFSRLPMYQRQGKTAFKKDLTNIIKLSQHLQSPEKKFKSIHVGGTNGKGSVSHMLASILQEAGYKVGLYTSPHLKDFRERIRINGIPIRKNCVIRFIKRNRSFLEQNTLSFFEMTVGLAFEHFAKKEVDLAIIEVGLGGRLDSTNIILPELSVITNISLDHTQMLGNTMAKIAFEKAGIIKQNTKIILGENNLKTIKIFQDAAKNKRAKLVIVGDSETEFQSDLKGKYQEQNIKTVLKTIEELQSKGYRISHDAIQSGLLNVRKNTGLRGRWEVLQKKPLVIADTAHNEAGIKAVFQQIKNIEYKQLHIVLGVVNDKDLKHILPLFPKDASYYFSKANIQRALNANELSHVAKQFGLLGRVYSTINQAFETAKKNASENDLIFIGGSTFTVAEVL